MIYALCRKIDFVENLRVFGVKIWTEISIRVKNLTFSMSANDYYSSDYEPVGTSRITDNNPYYE